MYVYDEHDSTFISFRKTMVTLSRYLVNSKMLFAYLSRISHLDLNDQLNHRAAGDSTASAPWMQPGPAQVSLRRVLDVT